MALVASNAGMERITSSSSATWTELTLPSWAGQLHSFQAAATIGPRKLTTRRRKWKGKKVVAAPVTGLVGVCFSTGQLEGAEPSWEARMQLLGSRRNTRSREHPRQGGGRASSITCY